MKRLSVSDVEYVAFRLAQKHLTFNEPIPDFTTRFPNVLESCVVVPFQTFSGKDLYPTLIDKASILFYLMIKNHPFQNGNKRLAITTVLVFLLSNNKWVEVDGQELYNFTVWVAQSPADYKDQVVEATRKFLRKNLTKANR